MENLAWLQQHGWRTDRMCKGRLVLFCFCVCCLLVLCDGSGGWVLCRELDAVKPKYVVNAAGKVDVNHVASPPFLVYN